MFPPLIAIAVEAFNLIAAEAPQSADGLETGGILLGHDVDERITVTTAGDPGPGAHRHADRFLRDLQHARSLADQAYERDYSLWIGEWHTHPLGPPAPSPRDMDTYAGLISNDELDFVRIASLIVTPCDVHGWTEVILHPWIITASGAYTTQFIAEGKVAEDG